MNKISSQESSKTLKYIEKEVSKINEMDIEQLREYAKTMSNDHTEIHEAVINRSQELKKQGNKYNSIKDKVTNEVIEKAVKRKTVKEYKEGKIKTGDKEIDEVIDEDIKGAKKIRKEYKKKDISYYFITINPKECEIYDLEIIMKKILKKKWCEMYCYVYEQRGKTEDEQGKGKHIHMIIKKKTAKSSAIKEIYESIKEYCDNKECIDIREISKYGKAIRERYMRGEKAEIKLQSVEIDKKWRRENKLKEIYIVKRTLEEVDEDEEYKKEYDELKEEINKENEYKNMPVRMAKVGERDAVIILIDGKEEIFYR